MSKKIIILLLLAITLIIPNISFASNVNTQPIREPDLLFFIDTFQNIKANYPFEIDDKTLIEGALKGMFQSVDDYSNYYSEEEADALYKSLLGEFSGIGVYIEEKDSYINIKDTIKNSPGEKAGLKKDDLIVSINGIDAKNMTLDNAQKSIQGEIGTKVILGIRRANKTLPIFIEVTRAKIVINPVEHKILENKIGYLKLSEFTQSSGSAVKKALAEFDKKGISKIIIDLRDNPGGLLNQAIEISRQFVPAGPIVHIKEKNKDLITHISTNQKVKYKLVVLVNENSASASEIVTGAIKDTKSGTIIGKKTFGKGIVQSMIPQDNGGIIKMTTAEYLTPNKTSIHGLGVEPDIEVENTGEEDKQLLKALKVLK